MSQSPGLIEEEKESALLHPAPHGSGTGQKQSPADATEGVEKTSEEAAPIMPPPRGASPVSFQDLPKETLLVVFCVPPPRQRWSGNS